mgnify:FL=1
MAATPIYDLVIPKGLAFSLDLNLKDPVTGLQFDLTGYTFKAQIRRDYEDPSEQVEFTCSTPTGPATGVLRLALTQNQTDALNAEWNSNGQPTGFSFYDAIIIDASLKPIKIMRGKAIPEPTATRLS